MQTIKPLAVVATLTFSAAALAHGGGAHVMGTVSVVDEKGLTVETQEKKTVRVLFDEKTKFEKDGAASNAKELTAGQRVVVHTAKNRGAGDPVAVLVKFGAEEVHTEEHHHAAQTVSLSVTEDGFTPDHVKVKKGAPIDLVITRKTAKTCATVIDIAAYGIKRELPLNEAVTINFTPTKTGEIKYSCGMGMLGGVLSVE